MINKPTIKDNNYDKKTNETIQKMIKIWDILLVKPPNDKKFNKKSGDYITDLFIIVHKIESQEISYSDDEIQKDIDHLYNKIFKNRRQ